ncbi:MAG: DUF881 domain-containing protein [Peptostreptococcaceae bacterium]|nr:DUF881 domain-containing protein [Peptostreptococcaceae bacterium]
MGKSKNTIRNIIFLICFSIGLIAVLQIRSIKENTIFFNRETIRDMEIQIEMENTEMQKLDEYRDRKRAELSELEAVENPQNLWEIMEKQNQYAKSLLGKTSFRGPGLKVEIRDSDIDILPTQNPNDFIVHDQDVLRIVNDLKSSGAEVISINNQIYHLGTEVKCSGATITVNGKTFAQPFIIRAIGNADILEAAIKSKDSYAYTISTLYGIRIDTSREDEIFIHSTMKNKQIDYLKEATKE